MGKIDRSTCTKVRPIRDNNTMIMVHTAIVVIRLRWWQITNYSLKIENHVLNELEEKRGCTQFSDDDK